MRIAELVMAIALAIVSIALMVKSAELPIGWIPEEGPGGGAFPFWISAGMLACCLWTIVRWVKKTLPTSTDSSPYMDRETLKVFLIGSVSLTVMVASIYVIGTYGAIPLLLIFYMRIVGKNSWLLTSTLAVTFPVATFFFFEIALRITLPKGLTEPMFYPLYDIFL